MPFLVGCLAIVFPRLALFLVWLFGGDYLTRAIDSALWLIAGFLFMPLTTLAFAYATNSMKPVGQVPDLGWVVIGVAALIDVGLVGSRSLGRRRRDAD